MIWRQGQSARGPQAGRAARGRLPILIGTALPCALSTWAWVLGAWSQREWLLVLAGSAAVAGLMLRTFRDRQRLQALYDDAPCGYHSLDEDGLYRRVNATELRWLGCTREEVIGKLGPADFYTEESRAVWRRSFAEYLRTGQAPGQEYELQGRDGTLRRVVVGATTLHDGRGRFAMTNSVMVDISELHRARADVRRFAEELEERVRQRTQDLRTMAAELDATESRERRRLARDLHDDLAQTLAAARMQLAEVEACTDAQARRAAARAGRLIDRANRSTRSLAAQLAPPMLYDLGLAEGLEWLAQEIGQSYGLQVSVDDDGLPKPLSHEARSILYRATRELLINSAKHAHADAAEVRVERRGDDIVVRVADSGVGFDARLLTAAKGHGMGLLSVRERLAFIGGSVDIRSIPGDGAVITLVAPLTPEVEVERAGVSVST